ncbi:HalOD1 output domain-containing protein [Haladaptatus salinisoli]|uniref:HalOD1 output domain-containing protein n=1 Tax=Haladaptatus salinisoli TaxID=2884876 RepID=UPI001D0A7C3F|nr:HalOD1 output domain-containing protein [Haladaptatus salinisoli]
MREEQLTERVSELDRDECAAYRIKRGDDDISTRIIRGVEDIVGPDEDNTAWLYDSIDPDALDTIFSPKHDGTPRDDGKVVFTARNCEISVRGNGEITVYVPRNDDPEE